MRIKTAYVIVISVSALIIAIVNFVLNLLPTAVLRSNTPALRRLYARSLAREEAETTEKTALE